MAARADTHGFMDNMAALLLDTTTRTQDVQNTVRTASTRRFWWFAHRAATCKKMRAQKQKCPQVPF